MVRTKVLLLLALAAIVNGAPAMPKGGEDRSGWPGRPMPLPPSGGIPSELFPFQPGPGQARPRPQPMRPQPFPPSAGRPRPNSGGPQPFPPNAGQLRPFPPSASRPRPYPGTPRPVPSNPGTPLVNFGPAGGPGPSQGPVRPTRPGPRPMRPGYSQPLYGAPSGGNTLVNNGDDGPWTNWSPFQWGMSGLFPYGSYYGGGYPFGFGWNGGNFLFGRDEDKDNNGNNYLYNGEYPSYTSNTCNCAGNSECLNNCYTSQSYKYVSSQ